MPIDEQISSVVRELKMRDRVYPRWVQLGKLTQENADLEMNRMRAVLATLQRVGRGEKRDHPELDEVRQAAYARVLCLFAPHMHSSKLLRLKKELEEAGTGGALF